MIKKVSAIFIFLLISYSSIVSAHVVVKPDEVGVAKFQTFTMGVPNEKDNPVVSLRLIIPDGVTSVTPNVKPGWTIEILKKKDSDNVSEIIWSSGLIPQDQRDDFLFSAKTPSTPTTLQWNAYQTYSNGSVVSWDQASGNDEDESENKGPYSETKVINDLASTVQNTQVSNISSNYNTYLVVSVGLSVLAILLSGFNLLRNPKK